MYEYKAKITNIVDADTFDVDIDLGFGIIKKERIRLDGIDAYETSLRRGTTPEQKKLGLAGKQWCIENVLDQNAILWTDKDEKGKYGRYVAVVRILFDKLRISNKNSEEFTINHDEELYQFKRPIDGYIDINGILVRLGFAIRKEY